MAVHEVQAERPGPRRRALGWAAIAAALCVILVGGWLRARQERSASLPEADALYAAVDRVLALRPVAAGRTSRFPAEGAIGSASAVLGFGPSEAVTEIARATADFERLAASREDANRLHPLGLLRAAEGKLDEAILLLEAARLADPARADVLADLASAHLSRFGEIGDPEDLFQALTAAERALAKEPGSAAALYNRALAVSWLHLVSEGKAAWEAYLAADAAEPWASVARQNLERLSAPTIEDRWKETRALLLARSRKVSDSEIRQVVADFPHRARMLVLTELLPQWARAWRTGRHQEARRPFQLAREIALALESATGDVLIRESVTATERAASRGRNEVVTRHAEAYELLSAGLELYYQQRYGEAEPILGRAEELFESLGDPLWGVPAFFLASSGQFSDPVRSSQTLRRLQQRFPADRYPQLSGFCDWVAGTIESTTGDSEEALRFFLSAQSKVRRSAADYGEGPVHVLLGDAHRLLGQEGAAAREYLAGLEWAALTGDRHRYHMALYPVVEMLVERGEPESARSLGDELVTNAEARGMPLPLIETYLQRGRILTLLGLKRRAAEDFRRARRHAEKLAGGALRDRTLATLSLAEAELLIGNDSEAAVSKLDQVLESKLQSGYLYHLTRTLSLRGQAHADLGAVAKARRDLLAAIEEYERLRAMSESDYHRRSTFELAQQTFDALIALEVQYASPPERILGLAERSKSRLIADLLEEAHSFNWREHDLESLVPPGITFVEYTLLPGQLLIWVVTNKDLVLEAVPVTRAQVETSIVRLQNTLSRRSDAEEVQAALASLYEVLIAPIASRLPSETSMVVVPDRVLARVPFAALYDSRGGKYLIEDRPVSLIPTIRLHPALSGGQASAASPVLSEGATALVIGDPEPKENSFSDLAPLLAARAEALEVADLYFAPTLLLGPAATVEAFRTEAPKHQVIHFAGHTRSARSNPSHSSLILAPSTSNDGALEAEEIAGLDLDETRVVILSACQSLDGDRNGRESVTGLTAAFFAAGTPAVVGSLWEVNDRTSREIVLRFHQGVAAGLEPVRALRRAQLALLTGEIWSSRHPRAWGGYVVVGQ